MRNIPFTKLVATGNDFVLIEAKRLGKASINPVGLARNICDRKFGIGADGLLLLERSKKADVKMRIFNADGSEAEMCGNGARCVASYVGKTRLALETRAGIILSEVRKDLVKIKLTQPHGIRFDIPIKINNRGLKVNFINTGVPHAVIFVSGVDGIDVRTIGRLIRFHKRFAPAGTNVNFVEVLDSESLKIRTYERGVEDETLACGTGSVASALVFALRHSLAHRVTVHTKSTELLKVYFKRRGNTFEDIWLEGRVKKVGAGTFFIKQGGGI